MFRITPPGFFAGIFVAESVDVAVVRVVVAETAGFAAAAFVVGPTTLPAEDAFGGVATDFSEVARSVSTFFTEVLCWTVGSVVVARGGGVGFCGSLFWMSSGMDAVPSEVKYFLIFSLI